MFCHTNEHYLAGSPQRVTPAKLRAYHLNIPPPVRLCSMSVAVLKHTLYYKTMAIHIRTPFKYRLLYLVARVLGYTVVIDSSKINGPKTYYHFWKKN